MTTQNYIAIAPTLLALARSGLTGKCLDYTDAAALTGPSWDDLCGLARQHDLLPLLWAGVSASEIATPDNVRDILRTASRIAEVRSDRAWAQIAEILKAFNQHGITPVLLKGVQVARRYYASPGMRPFSDIDILVKLKDRERAAEILREVGYDNPDEQTSVGRTWWLENHFHWNFTRGGQFVVEMHWDLTYPDSTVPLDVDSFWQRSEICESAECRYAQFNLDDELIFLACHIDRHWYRLPLRNQMDIAAIILRSPDFQWDSLMGRAAELKFTKVLLGVLGVGAGLGLFTLPGAVAEQVKSVSGSDFDIDLLTRYAIAWPFGESPGRLVALKSAPTPGAAAKQLWAGIFPKYVDICTPVHRPLPKSSRFADYWRAWFQRAGRLIRGLFHRQKLAQDLNTAARVYQIFGDRRGK